MKLHLQKITITLIYIICATLASFAQTKHPAKISGSLLDAGGNPMPYTSVSLLRVKDSAIVKGTLTTDAGKYTFDLIGAGTYKIKATAVGYANATSNTFIISDTSRAVFIPGLALRENTKSLQTVNISSTKPIIERKVDRMVMNVENSILAAGNSAMDILERAPGVSIDKDDNISLKGKQGVTVMINDKLTYLSSAQLATLLRSTDGTTIESIELITNPSAKYDASGNSGIINIKLKKNKNAGTTGSLTVNGGIGAYPKDNTSLSINHKQGNLNVFGNISRGDNQKGATLDIKREVIDGTGNTTFFDQNTFMPQTGHYNTYRLGADYDLSPKNTIGFIVNGYFNSETDNNYDVTRIGSTPAVADSLQRTNSAIRQTFKNIAINLNDRYQFGKKGQGLTFDLDYSKFNNTNNAQYNTGFFLPGGAIEHPPLILQNQSPSTVDIHTAKADYTYPVSKTMKLESGLKYSDVKTDNDLEAQILTNNTFVNDTSRTNRFVYDEKIAAGYVNLSQEYKNTSVQLGLRTEYTHSMGDLLTTNQLVTRNYIDLFPSLFINHSFSAKDELGFSYSRRIDRPGYDKLNPFIYYLDQYTYEQGNPFLKPQYTNKFELNYTYNKTLNVSAGYGRTSDVITQILLTNIAKKATYETNLNLQTMNSYNIDVNSPYTITKWFTGNINVNGYYNQFISSNLLGGNLNNGKFAYIAKVTQSLLFAGFRGEILESYNSSQAYGLFDVKPRYNVDAGVSRSFDNKKFNAKFAVSDVFNTLTNDVSGNFQTDIVDIKQKHETRVARLTLTYNFGNSKIKAATRETGAEDEKGRVKGNN